MNKLPWTKWYFSDWRNDTALSACSLEARGLWADMLAVMYDCENAGHLELAGKPALPEAEAFELAARELDTLPDNPPRSGDVPAN